jgi:hypothetical protein
MGSFLSTLKFMASLQRDRKKGLVENFGPGNISCNNTSLTKDISMHTFPSDDIFSVFRIILLIKIIST